MTKFNLFSVISPRFGFDLVPWILQKMFQGAKSSYFLFEKACHIPDTDIEAQYLIFLFSYQWARLLINKILSGFLRLIVIGTLSATILLILKNLKIKLFTHVISFNTLWDEESEIFLQIKLSIQNGSNIGLNHGFLRICLSIFQKYSNLDS